MYIYIYIYIYVLCSVPVRNSVFCHTLYLCVSYDAHDTHRSSLYNINGLLFIMGITIFYRDVGTESLFTGVI